MQRWVAALSFAAALWAGVGWAGVAAGEPRAVAGAVDRWAQAAGGWKRLAKVPGAVLSGTRTETGIESRFEGWIARGNVTHAMQQGPDRSGSVSGRRRSWVKDWNGKVLELQGRDATDQITATWLETVAYGGLTREALRFAHPVEAVADSTGAFDVVQFHPQDAVPFVLYLDRRTGLPARAERKPYDDVMVVAFGDWRPVNGVQVPFFLHEFTSSDSAGTMTVLEAVDLGSKIEASRFAPPADRAPDYRFATGNSACGIPFNFENDHIMVECSVNGRSPVWFMLDTGAGWTCINKTRLAEFGLETFGTTSVSGGGNSTDLGFTRVERLQVGGVEMLQQRAGVLEMNGLERLYGMPMGGILGYDFVSRFIVRVDYESKTMDVHAPTAGLDPDGGEKIPLLLERNHPHVRATVTVPGAGPIAADFVVDSGAAETANLTSPFVKRHHLTELARQAPAGQPNTIPGMEKQFFAQTSLRGKLGSLTLGPFAMTAMPVNLQMGTKGFYSRASFSGTIGEGILKRFTTTYDYSRGALVLKPNAEFSKPFPARKTFGATFVSEGPEFRIYRVSGIRKNSPAEAAGLAKGDVIEALDGKPAAEFRLADLRRALLDAGTHHVLDVSSTAGSKRTVAVTVATVSIEDD